MRTSAHMWHTDHWYFRRMWQSSALMHLSATTDATVVTIKPVLKPWQWTALVAWVALWCAALLVTVLSGATATWLLVYAAFWLYFMWQATKALLWYAGGAEHLKISRDELWYKRSVKGYGRVRKFERTTIKNIGLIAADDTFGWAYQQGFWTVGGEQLQFDYLGTTVIMGRRLNENQQRELLALFRK